jgi:hypothetical protein
MSIVILLSWIQPLHRAKAGLGERLGVVFAPDLIPLGAIQDENG